jgi:hypothetical protein
MVMACDAGMEAVPVCKPAQLWSRRMQNRPTTNRLITDVPSDAIRF